MVSLGDQQANVTAAPTPLISARASVAASRGLSCSRFTPKPYFVRVARVAVTSGGPGPAFAKATALAESLVAHLLALEGSGAIAQLEQAERSLNARGAYVP